MGIEQLPEISLAVLKLDTFISENRVFLHYFSLDQFPIQAYKTPGNCVAFLKCLGISRPIVITFSRILECLSAVRLSHLTPLQDSLPAQQPETMPSPLCEKITQAIENAGSQYYRLVLIVGKSEAGKTALLSQFAEEKNIPVINVNLQLSSRLIGLSASQRRLQIGKIFNEIADMSNSPVLLLDNIEVIFSEDLKQDPLRLLQSISRNKTIVASWSGMIESGKLFYAESNHPEYKIYPTVECQVIDLNELPKELCH